MRLHRDYKDLSESLEGAAHDYTYAALGCQPCHAITLGFRACMVCFFAGSSLYLESSANKTRMTSAPTAEKVQIMFQRVSLREPSEIFAFQNFFGR